MIIYNDLSNSNDSSLEFLTLEESTTLNTISSIPVINSEDYGYIVDNDYVSNIAESLDLDIDDVVEIIKETNNIDDLSVVIKEEDVISMDYNPNIRYIISPLSEDDVEYMYTDTCIYLSEAYDDDRYLYLLEDLEAYDEGALDWMKSQIKTAKDVWHQLTTGETPQQRAIRTGEGHDKELMSFKDRSKREQEIADKVQELKDNENGNHAWSSFNPNDKHEEALQKQKKGVSYFNRKKDDYNELRATGAGRIKSGYNVAKDIGKDAFKLAKDNKKTTAAIGGGIAALGVGALALKSPNVRKRIIALRNRIMGLEEKNKQGRFSKIIAKLKAILNKLTSRFKRNKQR